MLWLLLRFNYVFIFSIFLVSFLFFLAFKQSRVFDFSNSHNHLWEVGFCFCLLCELEKRKERVNNDRGWFLLKQILPHTLLYTHTCTNTHTNTVSDSNPCLVAAAGSSGLHFPITALLQWAEHQWGKNIETEKKEEEKDMEWGWGMERRGGAEKPFEAISCWRSEHVLPLSFTQCHLLFFIMLLLCFPPLLRAHSCSPASTPYWISVGILCF